MLTGDTLCALTTTVRSRKSMGGTCGLFLLVFFKLIQANTAYLDYILYERLRPCTLSLYSLYSGSMMTSFNGKIWAFLGAMKEV